MNAVADLLGERLTLAPRPGERVEFKMRGVSQTVRWLATLRESGSIATQMGWSDPEVLEATCDRGREVLATARLLAADRAMEEGHG